MISDRQRRDKLMALYCRKQSREKLNDSCGSQGFQMQQMRSGIPSPSNNTKRQPTDLISYKDGPTPFGGDLTPIVLD
jgi:hypothetical protein